MLYFKNRVLFYIINFFLVCIWQLPQTLLGLIMLAIFHNVTTYVNPYSKITVWNINCHHAFGYACFSTGPFIITCSDKVESDTLKHESGHSFQSIILGLFYHIVVSIPSVIRFWIRRLFNKSHEWYIKGWPEGGCRFGAEELGHTNRH